jgi:hypothetical protein
MKKLIQTHNVKSQILVHVLKSENRLRSARSN